MKKQTIGHLASTLALPALLLLAAACTSELPTPLTGTPTDGSDALQALPPETPVAIGATTRSATTDIPAWNEITDQTKIINTQLSAPTNDGVKETGAELLLPSASDFRNSDLMLGGNVPLNNLTGMTMTPSGNPDPNAILTVLRLNHLNLNATNADPNKCYSRLAIMEVGNDGSSDHLDANGNDFLYSVAKLSATGGSSATPGFNFRLHHASAKLSVLVKTTMNADIDMSEGGAVLSSASVTIYSTSATTVYTGGSTTDPKHFPIKNYFLNLTSAGSGQYPDDPDPETEIGVAIKGPNPKLTSPKSYDLKHPTQVNAPVSLLSVILPASATHDSFGTYYAPLETPQPYTDKNVLKLVLNNIVDDGTPNAGSPDGGTSTYSLKLTDIVLTGLPEGDKRRDTDKDDGRGHLLYLLPGEHLTITVKVDRKQIVFATGTIRAWSKAGASEDLTGDETKVGIIMTDKDDKTGVRTYTVGKADKLKALADWINGKSIDPISGKQDNTDANIRLKTNITLTGNIDLSTLPMENGSNWTPIGEGADQRYTGIFDGGGNTISGLAINRPDSKYQGLFGSVNGSVKNLTVEGSVTGEQYVGAIAGHNNGNIENCTNRAKVSSDGDVTNVGGMVGNNTSHITACTNAGEVKSAGYNASVGGVVGMNRGSLTACYNTGTVSGTEKANRFGGVAGYCSSQSSLTACYSTGKVLGAINLGALIGQSNGSLVACFYQWSDGVPQMGISKIDADATGSGSIANSGSNIDFAPVEHPDYNGSKTWDLVVGKYNSDNIGTLNGAIYHWNSTHNSSTPQHCPYMFIINPDIETNSEGGIPGDVGTDPLILVPIAD